MLSYFDNTYEESKKREWKSIKVYNEHIYYYREKEYGRILARIIINEDNLSNATTYDVKTGSGHYTPFLFDSLKGAQKWVENNLDAIKPYAYDYYSSFTPPKIPTPWDETLSKGILCSKEEDGEAK